MRMLPPCMPHSLIQRHAKAKAHMSEEQLLGYFVQLVVALAHVHAIGILHRDIKTTNVFLTGQGLLKLGDFGISKVRQTTRVHVSSTGRLLGMRRHGDPAAAPTAQAADPVMSCRQHACACWVAAAAVGGSDR